MTTKFWENIVEAKFWHLFIIFNLAYFLLAFLFSNAIWNDGLYESRYMGDNIDKYIGSVRTIDTIRYVLTPLYILFKLSIIVLLLSCALLIINTKIAYKDLFEIILAGEFIFLIPKLITISWFLIFQESYTAEDVAAFQPFSLASLVERENIEKAFIYPLETANLFELMYMLALASGLSYLLSIKYAKSFLLVISSYGLGVLFWVLITIFLNLK